MGNSHEREDLSRLIGYKCNTMNFIGYDEENTSLTDKDAWCKTYQDHVITEIIQLWDRMNASIKKSIIQGM